MPEESMNRAEAYGLDSPSRQQAIVSIVRVLGAEEARKIWSEASKACDLDGREDLSLDELDRIADHLREQGGLVSVVGNSLAIRIRSYRLLAEADAPRNSRPWEAKHE